MGSVVDCVWKQRKRRVSQVDTVDGERVGPCQRPFSRCCWRAVLTEYRCQQENSFQANHVPETRQQYVLLWVPSSLVVEGGVRSDGGIPTMRQDDFGISIRRRCARAASCEDDEGWYGDGFAQEVRGQGDGPQRIEILHGSRDAGLRLSQLGRRARPEGGGETGDNGASAPRHRPGHDRPRPRPAEHGESLSTISYEAMSTTETPPFWARLSWACQRRSSCCVLESSARRAATWARRRATTACECIGARGSYRSESFPTVGGAHIFDDPTPNRPTRPASPPSERPLAAAARDDRDDRPTVPPP